MTPERWFDIGRIAVVSTLIFLPQEKTAGSPVFAGTVVDLGALDIEAQKIGGDTMFSRIIALVENAEEQQAPVQKLADRVAAWLIPAVLVFLEVRIPGVEAAVRKGTRARDA